MQINLRFPEQHSCYNRRYPIHGKRTEINILNQSHGISRITTVFLCQSEHNHLHINRPSVTILKHFVIIIFRSCLWNAKINRILCEKWMIVLIVLCCVVLSGEAGTRALLCALFDVWRREWERKNDWLRARDSATLCVRHRAIFCTLDQSNYFKSTKNY